VNLLENDGGSYLVQHNDRAINYFWRGWKRDKRLELKNVKHRDYIKKLKSSKRFKIVQRKKNKK